jgi:hypothetical protein
VSAINGTGEPDVGPDIEWDSLNPPTVHECSFADHFHAPFCDGTCADVVMDELDVKILNEKKAWTRAGMHIVAVPYGVADQVCMPGMKIELFEMEAKLVGLIEAVQEAVGISDEAYNFHYRQAIYNRLKMVREANENRVKQERLAAQMGIAPKKILGPDGTPLS